MINVILNNLVSRVKRIMRRLTAVFSFSDFYRSHGYKDKSYYPNPSQSLTKDKEREKDPRGGGGGGGRRRGLSLSVD